MKATSPQTAGGTPVGTAEVDTADPVAGTWTIDVVPPGRRGAGALNQLRMLLPAVA
jgi:hypothetical protein